MTQKTKNIIGWILTALVSLVFIASASMKLMGGEELAKNAATMGLTADSIKIIGVLELLCIVVFIIPRTGVLGILLVAAYLGGAIVTHLEHNQPIIMPLIVQAIAWTAALIRFPELGRRLAGKTAV